MAEAARLQTGRNGIPITYDRADLRGLGHPLLEPGFFVLEPRLFHVGMPGQQILEAAEGSPPLNGAPQMLPKPCILDGANEAFHVAIIAVGIIPFYA